MLIQVDIDSTLYDADTLFAELAAEAGIKWPRKSYSWSQPDGILKTDGTSCSRDDLVRVFRRAHSKEFVSKNKPYKGAVETLNGIAEDYPDIEIAYVSDRHESQGAALRDWLEDQGFLTHPDQRVAVTKDKRHWMREHRPEIVIDDRVRTILFSRYELGSVVLSLMHNHNINLLGEADGIYILKDWEAIGNELRQIIPSLKDSTRVKVIV